MKHGWLSWFVSTALVLTGTFLIPNAKADEWNRKTIVQFSAPVEVPGKVLSAGTYVMKLMDSQSDRNIVMIMDRDEKTLYKMVLAIPAYRLNPTDHTVITFEERAANAPPAIKKWFYPGDNYGEEFVYKQAQPLVTQASLPVQSSPVISAQPAAPAPAPREEAKAVTPPAPTPPVEVAQATPPPAPAAPQAQPEQNQTPKELPKTGSELPLIGLLGGVSIFAGLCLRLKRT